MLRNALEEDGWKVGFCTGEDKGGLNGFLNGDIDVLIGSSAIATGFDGLQDVCSRIIVNVLPWTAAEFDQLKGRIYRQGQRNDKVDMIIPMTYADVNGERWSWCESKMQRLHFKKSIADAAVDGVVPEGSLRSPAQAYQDIMGWLRHLDEGGVTEVARPKLSIPVLQDSPSSSGRRRYGEFSVINRTWNHARSEITHERLANNQEEWAHYHTLYREARKDWAMIPFEEMIRWCQDRIGYTIGDFGCGEANLAANISDRHTVHSFDHVAINDGVTACDISHVPVEDEALDVAVFSLSLMGANFVDYLREGHRTLKIDGHIHILEAMSRFTDRDGFIEGLKRLGFDILRVEDKWKFTHIHGIKSERRPHKDVDLRF